jgi:hypothetical protein
MHLIAEPYRISSLHVRIVGSWYMAVKRPMQSFTVVLGPQHGAIMFVCFLIRHPVPNGLRWESLRNTRVYTENQYYMPS